MTSNGGSNGEPKMMRQVVSRYINVPCDTPELKFVIGRQTEGPRQVADLVRIAIEDEPVEVFVALLLSSKHRTTGFVEVSRGTLTSSLVHPREVFGPAIRMNAAAIVVAHNHPSGDPEPSTEDVSVTERLVEVGKIIGIPLLDHVVLGKNGTYVSLRERMGF